MNTNNPGVRLPESTDEPTVVKGNALRGIRCTIPPGSGDYHLSLAGCDDCDVRALSNRPLDWVEDRYHSGYVRQAMWEAYTHAWATGAPRFGAYENWQTAPTDPEVIALVELFQKRQAERAAEAKS